MPTEGDLVRALELLTLPPDSPLTEGLGEEVVADIEAARSWMGSAEVIGNGVSAKITSGVALQDLSFKVYVRKKLPNSALPQSRRVPPTIRLGDIPDFATDVEAIGEQRLENFVTKVRPLQPGYSVGLLGVETGTLGCLVCKPNDPFTPLLLSNSHVMAQFSLAPVGAAIVQPASDDGGGEAEIIGTLMEAVPFDFSPGFNNLCDAAIALPNDRANVNPFIPLIGVPLLDAGELERGQQVQKTGRSSGHTLGIIKDLHYRTYMSYPRPGGGWGSVGFRDQILCERYTASGDSGSLVCDMQGRAVGLHWCGSTSTSVFSPIAAVFAALGVRLWTPPR